MILAGDIGGTKTVLALYTRGTDSSLTCILEQVFKSQDFADFDDVLDSFLTPSTDITSACFGIAGPIVNQHCQMTNLSWVIDGEKLKNKLATQYVKLLNDLEAMAIGMLYLPEQDLVQLNPNAEKQAGNIAVIAAGTGLGEAILYWDGNKHQPMATEGGHCDFAPVTDQQDQLLAYLRNLYPDHVSYERIVSGIGFSHLYDFLLAQGFAPACPEVPEASEAVDRNAIISKIGIDNADPLCAETVRLFVEVYGAETGNLALKSLALGGIFIGGGIAPKIQPLLMNGEFMKAFLAKGRYLTLLNNISIKMSLNERTPLIGAINFFSL
jgi:glucokinase